MESEVRALLSEELKDAYSAEKQALRCMQKAGVGACVDGPSDARGKMRILTGRSIAIMCPAFVTRHHDRWPRWYPRSNPKHLGGFDSRCTKRVLWIVGFDRSSSHLALSSRHRRVVPTAAS